MTRWLLLLVAIGPPAALALPNMVRLGYGNCLSCHVAPQGGGMLNAYGRGIDEAQSLRAGEYQPNQNEVFNKLSLGGRIDQDFRGVLSMQLSHTPGGPFQGVSRTRFFYRNVTTLGKGFRVSAIINGENDLSLRRAKPYEPAARPGLALVTSALLQYRPRDGFEFAAGRDALPTGLNIPDQTTFIKARNRLGYYDTPTQAKAFLWGKRWLASFYGFAPSGREPTPIRESGGGLLAEYDLLGKGKTVIGVNSLHGSDRIGNRTLTGVYTRLGFGRWGVLGEHDFTARQLRASDRGARFGQHASYSQLFYYPREWMALSGIVERLSVGRPYAENLMAYKGELSIRLSSNWTIGLRAGTQRDQMTGRITPIASIQLTAKTVN
jgi:hypothetical protein